MKKQEVTNLIKEAIENKLMEHTLTLEVNKIYETRQDLQSVVLLSVMEELSGKKIPDPTVLDEGVWEKAKAMLAKIRLSKSTGAAEQRAALEAAADKAANQKFSQLMGSLKQMPGFDKYPNNESEEEFVGITTAIGLMHQAVSEAHKDGMIETDTANSLISNLKSYADGLNKDLSYSYRYLNEDDEEDTLDEGQLNERVATNYNRAIDLMKYVQDTPVADMKPRKLKALTKIRRGLEKELAKRTERDGAEGIMSMTNKEQDLLSKFASQDSMFRKKGLGGIKVPDEAKGAVDALKKGKGALKKALPGRGGSKFAGQDFSNPDRGSSMDLAQSYEAGQDSMSAKMGRMVDKDRVGQFAQDMSKATRVGDIDGVSSLPKLYQQAGSMATLSSWLGPGFLQSLAGFALPVAGIAGIAGLVGKRLMGKSREGSLKKLSGMMNPVDASEQGTEAPEAASGQEPGGEDPQAAQGGGEDPQATPAAPGARWRWRTSW